MLKVGKAVLDRGGHPANQPGLLLFGNRPRPSGSQVAVQVPISPQAQILLLSFPAKCLICVPRSQEHQALLSRVREGELALEELRTKNADCQAEKEK